MAVVDELVAILGYEVKGQEKLRQFNQSIETAARRLTMFAAAAATAAAGAAALLGRSVIQTSAQFESFQATLETVEGSSEKARASLDWISDFAKKTPFEVEELTRSFVKLRAYGMDPTTGLLEDLGNASSAMGKSLMDAVEMIADASTGEFERLKEFGIRASQAGDQVTFSWTENGKTLTKTVKKSGDEITKFIQERFGARFSGAMLRQSKTWNGMMSNLSDSWTDFQRRIGEGGFFEAVKRQLGRVLDFIARLDTDGTLDRWSENLAWAFTKASNFFADFAERMGRHFGTISRVIAENKGAFEWMLWALGAIAVRLFPAWVAFGLLAVAIEDVLQWMGDGKSVIGDFVAAMEDFLGLDRGQLNAIAGTLLGLSGLAVAAAGVGLFTLSLSPLTRALLAFAAAFAGAKAGFEFLQGLKTNLDNKIAGTKAVDNPKSKPGYIESAGYDSDGKFIYMNGAARVDKPTVNTTEGFTQDALDLKFMLQNAEENLAKMGAGQAGAAVENTVNDSSDKSVNVTINQTVQQATDAPAAAASATANAAAGAASRSLPPPRFVPGGV